VCVLRISETSTRKQIYLVSSTSTAITDAGGMVTTTLDAVVLASPGRGMITLG
jgi:hypothetical protein